jgi:hypothetical protein
MTQILISTRKITIIERVTTTTITTMMTIGILFPAASSGTEVVTALIRTGARIKIKINSICRIDALYLQDVLVISATETAISYSTPGVRLWIVVQFSVQGTLTVVSACLDVAEVIV